LNELPLDDAPSASEVDLLAKLASVSDGNRQIRAHGRSLDSLAPLGSDKLFLVEKRVSSVEIIIDSLAGSSRPSISSQMSRDSAADENDSILLPTSGDGHSFLAPSSCDASSEGTLSDSEFSDAGVNDGSSGPVKSHPRTRRVRRSGRSDPSNLHSSTPIKSPTKRRMENLSEIPPAATGHMTRSVSCGGINSNQLPDCSKVKRSKVCRSMSDLLGGKSPKKGTGSHACTSLRKISLHRSTHKLNFSEDISDHAPPSVTGSKQHCIEQHVIQHATGMYVRLRDVIWEQAVSPPLVAPFPCMT